MIKQTAAKIFVQQKLKKHNFNNQSFSFVFEKSKSVLVLMPEDDNDFHFAVDILSYLDKIKKEIFILTNDFRVSLLPLPFRGKTLGHGIKDVNAINLPSRGLVSKLLKKRYDALIDLNRKEQLFYIYVSGIVEAEISIGFTKNLADKVYNLQIDNSETNPKISYENLLNCLKML
jgi:Family of unknown function (DUF6913)